MKIEIKDEILKGYRISKDFVLELEDGTELTVNKYAFEDDIETDNDYDFDDKSKEIFDKLPEEQQDEITDFINAIKL